MHRPRNHLLHVPPRLDLRRVPTILTYDRLLVRHILDPVDILCSTTPVLSLICQWAESREDQDRAPAAAGVVHGGAEALRADVDVPDDALGLAREAGIAVGHGEGDHLVRAGDDAGEGGGAGGLAFDDGFEDGRVVGAEVDEAVRYPGLRNERDINKPIDEGREQ